MPTSFNTSFDDSGDDIIHASHVTQYAAPINALETAIDLKQDSDEKGVANGYASLDASGKVPSSQLPSPGASALDDLTDVAITSPASGQVIRHNGTQFVNAALAAGDLPAHTHAIADVTNLQTSLNAKQETSQKGAANGYAGLDSTGKVPSSQLPATGATNLDALTDVAITSPASGQVIRHNGTQFVNSALSASDIASGTVPIANGGTGASSAANARTNLDVPSNAALTSGLAAKQDSSAKNVANGYAGLDASSKLSSSQMSEVMPMNGLSDVAISGPVTGQTLRYNGTSFVNAALSPSDVGAAAASHSHPISDVTNLQTSLDAKQATAQKNAANGYAGLDAGSKLAVSQMNEVMPMNGLSDVAISGPATGQTVRYNGTNFVNAALSPSDVGAAAASHTHAAGDITSGELGVVRGGTGASSVAGARTNLDVPSNADLTSGLAAKQNVSEKNAVNGYAGLDAGGQVSVAQGGTGANLSSTGGTGQILKQSSAGADVTVEPLIASDLPSHTHDTADITSGSLGLARGGTGSDLSATGGDGQVLKQSTMGGPVTVGTLAASEMPGGIDAVKIGDGLVSNTEFGYLDGVTSSVQAQLNTKVSGSGVANRVPYWSGSSALTSGSNFTFSSMTGEIYAGSYRAYQGSFSTSVSHISLFNSSGLRARFTGSQAHIYNIGVYGTSGAVVYRYTSGGSVGELHHLSSSKKNKRNIQTMETISSKLKKMRPVRFEGTAPPLEGSAEVRFEKAFGLIAEEVAPLFPDLCYQIPGSEDPAGIHYDRIPIYLLAGWLEQQKRIEELELRLDALESYRL